MIANREVVDIVGGPLFWGELVSIDQNTVERTVPPRLKSPIDKLDGRFVAVNFA